MKRIGKVLLTLFCIITIINLSHWTEHLVKNKVYKILPGDGFEREMDLIYLGTTHVDLANSTFADDMESYLEYTNCWQISGLYSYEFFKEEIGFDKPGIMVGTTLFTNSYVISYGRKLEKATYNTKNYWECGYYVDFTFDRMDYQPGIAYIYWTDAVDVGNIMWLN